MSEDKKKQSIKYYIVLAIIIALSIARCIYIFCVEKEGHHVDETWQYGFANSSNGGYIYMQSDDVYMEAFDYANFDAWTSGEVLFDYIAVTDGEKRFDTGNVAVNTAPDLSPPLSEMLLHVISSFFPNRFSWWYAFSINLVCAVGILFIYQWLAHKISDNEYFALITTAFLGLSTAFDAMVIYLRMYAMLTLFAVALLALNYMLYEKDYKNATKEYMCLAIVTIGGCLTHYMFLPYAFVITVFLCIRQMIRKQWKSLAMYALVMAGSVGLFFVFYPYGFRMIFGNGSHVGEQVVYPFSVNLNTAINAIFSEIFGVHDISYRFVLAVCGVLLLMVILVLYAGREKEWAKASYGKYLDAIKNNRSEGLRMLGNRINWFVFMLLFVVVGCIHFTCRFTNVEIMGARTDRYLFMIVPSIILMFTYVLFWLLKTMIKHKNANRISVITVLLVCVLFSGIREGYLGMKCPYTWNRGEDKTNLTELTKDANVIILLGNPYELQWYTVELRECEQFYAMSTLAYTDELKLLNEPDNGRPTYFIIEADAFLPEDIDMNSTDPEYIAYVQAYLNQLYTMDTMTDCLTNIYNTVDWIEGMNCEHISETFFGRLLVFKVN